ncbi:ATP-dependent DNA helicase sgs1 [Puccinia graminis f. sp. tritici]|uniref:ATP-dependent DNA helicase sgs1 n=1 Tax=Puccinia graminis f. sp. tritici TaxID=56615 RepID=A0A5B0MY59_PUCGR|nr:ATP-dependent DNA helicase sgs1 [Puccinia graminis f. sp. tritici]
MAQIMKANLALYVLQERIRRGHQLYSSVAAMWIPGYPPVLGGKTAIRSRIRIRWRVSAGTGGYPPADSGYPRRIIRDHL